MNIQTYYRFEMRHTESTHPNEWVGAFQLCPLYYLQKINRVLHCPTLFQKYGSSLNTRSWFTQHGYEKWGKLMEECLDECCQQYPSLEWRLVVAENVLPCIMRGKTQVVQLLE